jgi:hypothetical protein
MDVWNSAVRATIPAIVAIAFALGPPLSAKASAHQIWAGGCATLLKAAMGISVSAILGL